MIATVWVLAFAVSCPLLFGFNTTGQVTYSLTPASFLVMMPGGRAAEQNAKHDSVSELNLPAFEGAGGIERCTQPVQRLRSDLCGSVLSFVEGEKIAADDGGKKFLNLPHLSSFQQTGLFLKYCLGSNYKQQAGGEKAAYISLRVWT